MRRRAAASSRRPPGCAAPSCPPAEPARPATACRRTCRDHLAIATAVVYLHRFYALKSLRLNDPFVSGRAHYQGRRAGRRVEGGAVVFDSGQVQGTAHAAGRAGTMSRAG